MKTRARIGFAMMLVPLLALFVGLILKDPLAALLLGAVALYVAIAAYLVR